MERPGSLPSIKKYHARYVIYAHGYPQKAAWFNRQDVVKRKSLYLQEGDKKMILDHQQAHDTLFPTSEPFYHASSLQQCFPYLHLQKCPLIDHEAM